MNIADELRKLGDLRTQGVLTDEEFTSPKAALLRSLHAAAPPETRQCDECGGAGACERCHGDGHTYFRISRLASPEKERCDDCSATGKCPKCKGRGQVVVDRPRAEAGPGAAPTDGRDGTLAYGHHLRVKLNRGRAGDILSEWVSTSTTCGGADGH